MPVETNGILLITQLLQVRQLLQQAHLQVRLLPVVVPVVQHQHQHLVALVQQQHYRYEIYFKSC